MEKDKVQSDDACQKRSRNKTQAGASGASCTAAATTTTTSTSSGGTAKAEGAAGAVNGSAAAEETRPSRNSSYSITSLLSEYPGTTKRCSPEANSPSHYSRAATRPQYCSPTPPSEDGWYSESVDRLRSIELSVSKTVALFR